MELLKPGADDSIIPAGNPQPESTQEENTRNKNKSQFLLQNRWLVISQKEKKQFRPDMQYEELLQKETEGQYHKCHT